MNYHVISAGDSFNDTAMLVEADVGILFRAPDNVKRSFRSSKPSRPTAIWRSSSQAPWRRPAVRTAGLQSSALNVREIRSRTVRLASLPSYSSA